MNGQLLEEINTTMFTSSKQGKELVRINKKIRI